MTFMRKFLDLLRLDDTPKRNTDTDDSILDEETILNNIFTVISDTTPLSKHIDNLNATPNQEITALSQQKSKRINESNTTPTTTPTTKHDNISKKTSILNQKNNFVSKQNNRKQFSSEDFNAFMWQCNSIATMRDNNSSEYEYTELDNPKDALEVGYRDALLSLSDYNMLPLIDTSKDKYTPEGYVARKLINWFHDYENCNNIFKDSELPIIKNLNTITRYITTTVFQNEDGQLGRTVNELFYYDIPPEYEAQFLLTVQMLNDCILICGISSEFLISIPTIKFCKTQNEFSKNALPLSRIEYDTEKQIFSYIFANEVLESTNTDNSHNYTTTESGNIEYKEDGQIKGATFKKLLNGHYAHYVFKNYKAGFALYTIKYNDLIIYHRKS